MAAVSRDRIDKTNKDKVEKAWKNVLTSRESKSKAEFMQHE